MTSQKPFRTRPTTPSRIQPQSLIWPQNLIRPQSRIPPRRKVWKLNQNRNREMNQRRKVPNLGVPEISGLSLAKMVMERRSPYFLQTTRDQMRLNFFVKTYDVMNFGTILRHLFFLKKWAIPGLFLFIFGLFQTNNNTILQQNNVKKCPSSILHWDSNPRPSGGEYLPITTRPGLPPNLRHFICFASLYLGRHFSLEF